MSFTASLNAAWLKVEQMFRHSIELLPNLVFAVLVFGLFLLSAAGLKRMVHRMTERAKRARNVALVLGRLAQSVVILVGLFIALSILIPSFKAGSLVQLLGISGVAIGFAFRDILQNFLAGILILLTEPFRIGDQIRFKDYEGTVEDILTRATLIKTYDGRRVVVPNAELFTNSVTVNTAFNSRRIEYDFGIGYGDDVDFARTCILEAIQGVEGILADPPPDVIVMDFAASTVNIRARWWVSPPRRSDCLEYRDLVLRAVKKRLAESGIDLPFPTQHILFHDQTETTDGNRAAQREGWPKGKSSQTPAPAGIAAAIRNLTEVMSQERNKGEDARTYVDKVS